jgi:hypothetical protein
VGHCFWNLLYSVDPHVRWPYSKDNPFHTLQFLGKCLNRRCSTLCMIPKWPYKMCLPYILVNMIHCLLLSVLIICDICNVNIDLLVDWFICNLGTCILICGVMFQMTIIWVLITTRTLYHISDVTFDFCNIPCFPPWQTF